jgi:hypothetical protein
MQDIGFYEVSEGYSVYSWSPTPQAEVDAGKPQAPSTQVHLHLPVGGATLIMRFKSARAADEMIDALMKHRKDVWGERDEG